MSLKKQPLKKQTMADHIKECINNNNISTSLSTSHIVSKIPEPSLPIIIRSRPENYIAKPFNINQVLTSKCYYKDKYQSSYWRDGKRVGYAKAEYVIDNNLSANDTQIFLSNITIYEAMGIIEYCKSNKEEYPQLVARFKKSNLYGDKIELYVDGECKHMMNERLYGYGYGYDYD